MDITKKIEEAETTAIKNCDNLPVPLNTCWTFWIDKLASLKKQLLVFCNLGLFLRNMLNRNYESYLIKIF